MVSDALRAFSGHFEHWAKQGGVQMDSRVCQLLSDQFAGLVGDASVLEGAPVPVAFRAGTYPGVVNLSVEREARLPRPVGGVWPA